MNAGHIETRQGWHSIAAGALFASFCTLDDPFFIALFTLDYTLVDLQNSNWLKDGLEGEKWGVEAMQQGHQSIPGNPNCVWLSVNFCPVIRWFA